MEEREIVVKVTDVTKTINSRIILDCISFSVYRGEIVSVVGKNASGKSMLFKTICGLIRPTRGSVEVFGKPVGVNGRFAQNTGGLIEHPGLLPHLSAFANLQKLAAIRKIAADRDIRLALRRVGLDPDDRRPARKFSLGMRQKLGIAQAIFEGQQLLVLDEPSNNLDSESVARIRCLLQDLNQSNQVTILMASHQQADIDLLSHRVLSIDEGRIRPAGEEAAHEKPYSG